MTDSEVRSTCFDRKQDPNFDTSASLPCESNNMRMCATEREGGGERRREAKKNTLESYLAALKHMSFTDKFEIESIN